MAEVPAAGGEQPTGIAAERFGGSRRPTSSQPAGACSYRYEIEGVAVPYAACR